ncbi:MAG TPA: ATP-binding protein [Kofleriaceae bacterium]|nr:ATP-binding protein [Kofleriaceae bacterium]
MTSEELPSDHEIIPSLADDLPVGLWVARAPHGEFVYANRMFAEIMGQPGRDDVQVGGYSEPYGICTRDGKPYPESRLPFVRALEERRVVVVDDLMIVRPDRSRVDVRAFARPVANAAGAITHVVIAFIDITREVAAERARVDSEQRLHRAQRLEAIGTLAGGIAHDFNNLIFGIKLIANDLAAHEADEERRASLQLIDDITERSAMLTRSLLGFARRGKHRAMPVALDDTIQAMRELLARTLVGVAVEFELAAEGRGTVIGDQSQLEQVVMNLVVNARDAVHDTSGGRVLVRTYSAEGQVVLEVADNGPGIPHELRERVFEPYFTTKLQGAERGTGLGLATVFGIVESHGGAIEIASGLDGRGTTMRVQLPAHDRASAAVPAPRSRATPAGDGGVVLVVDDDAIVRRAVTVALSNLGYTPIEAGGGNEAIAIYRARQPEVRAVVLDMVMPAMSGRATYAALRELDPGVCVLLMSGHAMNEDAQGLIDLGVRGFLSKPFSLEALARALAGVLTPAAP